METATTPPTIFFESKLYELDFIENFLPKFKAADMIFLNQLPMRTIIPIDQQKSILRTFYRENSSVYFFADKIKPILSEINEHPTQSLVEQSCALVTPNGYGKTREAFLLACNNFSIYSNFTSLKPETPLEPFEQDYCMKVCYDQVQFEMKNVSTKQLPLSILEAKFIHTIFLKQILLKLIVLYFWIEKYGNEFKPYHFLLSQLNTGSLDYGKLLTFFYDSTATHSFYWTLTVIKQVICALDLRVNIITDEASFLTYQFKDQFLSRLNNLASIFSAYSNALIDIGCDIRVNLVCGTSMRLVNTSGIVSSVLKSVTAIYELPSTGNDKQVIINYWNRFIKVDDLDLANNLESKFWEMIFFSRWKLVAYVVENISFKNLDIVSQYYYTNATDGELNNLEKDATQVKEAKLRVMRFAIQSAFTMLQKQIINKLEDAISSNLIEKRELQQLYLETLLSPKQYVRFEHSKTKQDFVNLGITLVDTAYISPDQISVQYNKIQELLTLKAVATCIELGEMTQEINSVLLINLRSTYNAQFNSSQKEKPFEMLFIASLLSTNDNQITVGEKFKIEASEHTPKWLFEVPFVLKDFGTTTKYDVTSNNDTIALLNIIKNNYNAALIPSVFMKPNIIIPLLHDNKLYLIVFGFTYYSKNGSIGTVCGNESSTDLSKVYLIETSQSNLKQDEHKAKLFYSWFANCQNREYVPIDSHDRSCKVKTSNLKVNLNQDAMCVANILRVQVCLSNSKQYSTETCYYKNGDASRYFNLENLKTVISQDAYQQVQFAYKNYIANQKGLTIGEIIEPATKRSRIETSSSSLILQSQANTAKVLHVRFEKVEKLRPITLYEHNIDGLVNTIREAFSDVAEIRDGKFEVFRTNSLLPLDQDMEVAKLTEDSILRINLTE